MRDNVDMFDCLLVSLHIDPLVIEFALICTANKLVRKTSLFTNNRN